VHAVDVTVLHPSGDSQLAFAHLPPAPVDVPRDEAARLRDADDRLLRAAVGDDPAARSLYQIMINSVSHDLSLLRLFTGAPASVDHVATWSVARTPALEPSVEVSGRLPSGGRYRIGWHYLPDYPAYRETVTLHHARGSFQLAFPSPYLLNAPTTLTVVDGRDGSERHGVFRAVTGAFEHELLAFHAMVTGGSAPLTGIAGGMQDVVTSQQVVRRFGELTGAAISGEAAQA
jgi:predicted dehydrogenase